MHSKLSNFSEEMFYLNSIEQLFFFVEQLDQLEVCLPSNWNTNILVDLK